MKFRLLWRRGAWCALVLAASAAAALAQSREPFRRAPGASVAAVNGLIVQLHAAPSHVALARGTPQAQREGERWQRVVGALHADAALLRELPALAQAPRRDPVAGSAQLLRFSRPLTRAEADRVAAALAARPEVAWVEPNVREQRQQVAGNPPGDPLFGGLAQQWWLQPWQGSNAHLIEGRLRGVPGFQTAWMQSSVGSPGAVVAVLDSGITAHPELAGRILPGYDFVHDWDPVARLGYANDGDGRDADASDPGDWVDAADRVADATRYADCTLGPSSWHGSVIAGMVAAQTDNGVGVAAMNWNGRVLPVRVAGKCGADVADIVEGMRWAAGLPVAGVPDNANPARIVNISFGSSAVCGALYQQAIDELWNLKGAVVVAAAGNHWGAPSRPASCQRVIGVGALNRDGFKANYSNFGAALTISTVGGDDDDGAWGSWLADSGILTLANAGTTLPGASDYARHYGTSFSAPVVAGALSLMLSVNPALTAEQLVQGLTRSARPHVRFPAGVAHLGVCSHANPGRCQCTTSTCGAGILDVAEALRYANNPGGYFNPRTTGELIDTPELRAAAARGPDRPPNPPEPPPPDSGSGGGAMSAAWLLALALAAWALRGPLSASQSQSRRARSPRPAPHR